MPRSQSLKRLKKLRKVRFRGELMDALVQWDSPLGALKKQVSCWILQFKSQNLRFTDDGFGSTHEVRQRFQPPPPLPGRTDLEETRLLRRERGRLHHSVRRSSRGWSGSEQESTDSIQPKPWFGNCSYSGRRYRRTRDAGNRE